MPDKQKKTQLKIDMQAIFESVQHNVAKHETNMSLLMEMYKTADEDEFLQTFIGLLLVSLNIGDSPYVDRTLEFCAKFCISLNPTEVANDSTGLCPFFLAIVNFLLTHLTADSLNMRYRACQLISRLLNSMGENAELDDDLYNKILAELLKRMQDIKHQVRAQAVNAMHRLQNPSDKNDPVMKAFLFHVECDPNARVRRAVINNAARSSVYVAVILNRTRDVDERIRRDSYKYLGRFNFKYFKIKQRQEILKSGLLDRSNMVKRFVTQTLLPKWWTPFENFFDFVECLVLDGNENLMKESVEVIELVLNVYFRNKTLEEIIEQLPLESDKNLSIVNQISVLYWKNLASFLKKEQFEDHLDSILPDMTLFCQFIENYLESKKGIKDEWVRVQHQYTLLHFLDLVSHFDMSDEVGRDNLKKLCIGVLTNEKLFDGVIEKFVLVLSQCILNEEKFFEKITSIISDIVEPIQEVHIEKNLQEELNLKSQINELRIKMHEVKIKLDGAVSNEDYSTAQQLKVELRDIQIQFEELKIKEPVIVEQIRTKCTEPEIIGKALSILISVMLLPKTNKLYPVLRSLQQEFVMEYCVMVKKPKIQMRALHALALCCYLDLNLAKNNIHIFFLQIMTYQYHGAGDIDVVVTCIGAITDLLLLYGLDEFSPENEPAETKVNTVHKRTLCDMTKLDVSIDNVEPEDSAPEPLSQPESVASNEIISVLVGFLENDVSEIRTVAAKCLCKLFIQGRINSSKILSRLTVIWFNPATEQDNELRQVVGVLISYYAEHVIGSQEVFLKAFIPTFNIFRNAPPLSPLIDVDLELVIKFFISHTQPGFNRFEDTNMHTMLAFLICKDLLQNPDGSQNNWLLKALMMLNVNFDDTGIKEDLHKSILSVYKKTKNKVYLNMIKKFIVKHFEPETSLRASNVLITSNETDKVKVEVLVDETAVNGQIESVSSPEMTRVEVSETVLIISDFDSDTSDTSDEEFTI